MIMISRVPLPIAFCQLERCIQCKAFCTAARHGSLSFQGQNTVPVFAHLCNEYMLVYTLVVAGEAPGWRGLFCSTWPPCSGRRGNIFCCKSCRIVAGCDCLRRAQFGIARARLYSVNFTMANLGRLTTLGNQMEMWQTRGKELGIACLHSASGDADQIWGQSLRWP